jgi:hypothetical protein
MSFLPRSTVEWDSMFAAFRAGMFQFSDPEGTGGNHDGEYFDLIWPLFRHGRSGITRLPDMALSHLMGDEDHIHALRQGRLSSDSMFLAGRLRAAAARGELDELEINPALRERRDQFESEQRELQEAMPRFIAETVEVLRGRRVWIIGTFNVLYGMARAGLDAGLSEVFSPDSMLTVGGGAKGVVLPDDWEDDVRRFTGIQNVQPAYAMTEMTALCKMCEQGRYHFEPWIVPFVLDPDDGRVLPREGEQTGRCSLFDLAAQTYWGGFISGDEVSLRHDVCECGRTTPSIGAKIERYSEKQGGDDKITCAASDEAHASALEFLNERLA